MMGQHRSKHVANKGRAGELGGGAEWGANIGNTEIYCAFFRAGFRSYDRR